MGHGCTLPAKRLGMAHNTHYATRIGVWWAFVAARLTDKGGIICRIRSEGRGAGVFGDIFSMWGRGRWLVGSDMQQKSRKTGRDHGN